MKTLITSILVFLYISVNAQDKVIDSIPKVNGEYGYQNVVNLDSTYKKDFLYKNAKIYFVNTFRSAKDVIQYDNKADGKIIGKGLFTLTDNNFDSHFVWDFSFTTEITCKDGRYRYRIYDFSVNETRRVSGQYGGTYVNNWNMDEIIKKTQTAGVKRVTSRLYNRSVIMLNNNITSLKEAMSKKDAVSKDDF